MLSVCNYKLMVMHFMEVWYESKRLWQKTVVLSTCSWISLFGGAIPGQMMMRMKSPMSRFSCMRMFGQTELFLKMVRRISI